MYINFKCVIDNNHTFISHCSLTLYFYINLFFKSHYIPPCDGTGGGKRQCLLTGTPGGYRGVNGHRSGITLLAPDSAPLARAVNFDHQRAKRKVDEIPAAEATSGEWAAMMATDVQQGDGWATVV